MQHTGNCQRCGAIIVIQSCHQPCPNCHFPEPLGECSDLDVGFCSYQPLDKKPKVSYFKDVPPSVR